MNNCLIALKGMITDIRPYYTVVAFHPFVPRAFPSLVLAYPSVDQAFPLAA